MNSKPMNLPEHDDVDQFKNTESGDEPQDAGSIYENGNVLKINIDELKGNDVAIRQLVNGHNLSQKELRRLNNSLANREAEIEYLRTSPFVSIFSLAFNTISVTVVGVGVNILTDNEIPGIGLTLVIIGGIGSICSSISTILYPYARRFFNKEAPRRDKKNVVKSR